MDLLFICDFSKFLRMGAGLDGPQKYQVDWRGYLNPKSGSPAIKSGSPATFIATILYCFSGELPQDSGSPTGLPESNFR